MIFVLGVPQNETAFGIALRILSALRKRGLIQKDEEAGGSEEATSLGETDEDTSAEEEFDAKRHKAASDAPRSSEEQDDEEKRGQEESSSDFDEYEGDVFFSETDIYEGLREARGEDWKDSSEEFASKSVQSQTAAFSQAVHAAVEAAANGEALFLQSSVEDRDEDSAALWVEEEPLPIELPKGLSPEALGLYFKTETPPQNPRVCGRPPFSLPCVEGPGRPIARVKYKQTARELLDALGADGIYYGFVVSEKCAKRKLDRRSRADRLRDGLQQLRKCPVRACLPSSVLSLRRRQSFVSKILARKSRSRSGGPRSEWPGVRTPAFRTLESPQRRRLCVQNEEALVGR